MHLVLFDTVESAWSGKRAKWVWVKFFACAVSPRRLPSHVGHVSGETSFMQLRGVFIAIMAAERLWWLMLLRNLKGPLVPKVH